MVTLDDLMARDHGGQAKRRAGDALVTLAKLIGAGFYGIGWLLAKLAVGVLLAIGGTLYGIGWLARRAGWPALCWAGRAVRLGWSEGRRGADGRE